MYTKISWEKRKAALLVIWCVHLSDMHEEHSVERLRRRKKGLRVKKWEKCNIYYYWKICLKIAIILDWLDAAENRGYAWSIILKKNDQLR